MEVVKIIISSKLSHYRELIGRFLQPKFGSAISDNPIIEILL
jgi:hypothetical protein